MDLQLKGKIAIVTGASKGIGRAIAEALANEGCHLAICARGVEALEEARAALSSKGVKVFSRTLDVGDPALLESFLRDAIAELGGVDVLVNNCSAFGRGSSLRERWQNSFNVDIYAAVLATEVCAPVMAERGGGSIVHISSLTATMDFGPGAYGPSKAAMIAHAKSAATIWAPRGVRVNAVLPGALAYEGGFWQQQKERNPESYNRMLATLPAGRFGRPGEIAAVVAFLASPVACWVTGTHVVVDGGQNKAVF